MTRPQVDDCFADVSEEDVEALRVPEACGSCKACVAATAELEAAGVADVRRVSSEEVRD